MIFQVARTLVPGCCSSDSKSMHFRSWMSHMHPDMHDSCCSCDASALPLGIYACIGLNLRSFNFRLFILPSSCFPSLQLLWPFSPGAMPSFLPVAGSGTLGCIKYFLSLAIGSGGSFAHSSFLCMLHKPGLGSLKAAQPKPRPAPRTFLWPLFVEYHFG